MKERPAIGLFKGVKEMPVLAAVAVPHPPLIIPEVGKGEEKKNPAHHQCLPTGYAVFSPL